MARQWRSAARASAAIERLPAGLRNSRVVPGGGLWAHEGIATERGHTLRNHVGRTRQELARRLKTDPNLQWSSSFTDRATAELAISLALAQDKAKLASWLASNAGTLIIDAEVDFEVGRALSVGEVFLAATRFRVVLRKDTTVLGYYIRTAFPTP